jgi:hypothetical protein
MEGSSEGDTPSIVQQEGATVDTNQAAAEHTPVLSVLEQMPEVSEPLKDAVNNWGENLFGLDYVRNIGVDKYLDSDNSLYQFWGSAAQLEELMETASAEGRELSPDEKERIKEGFKKAANTRRGSGNQLDITEAAQVDEIANGIDSVIEIAKKIRRT